MVCAICRQERKNCKVFQLTETEKREFREKGNEVPEELAYCQPCWKTVSDPVSGPALMKGMLQIQLQQLGVSNAEDLASKFHTKLLKNSKRRS